MKSANASAESKAIDVTLSDPRWAAVLARDPTADGTFYYAVKTTGVYCRPSCASRRARPENISFHATRQEAESLGFRPCMRCRPHLLSPHAHYVDRITLACRHIDAADTPPDLKSLAALAGMSPYHFHRVFKKCIGLTPRAYAVAQREKRMLEQLDKSRTVTEAIFEAGYGSNSRFYEKAEGMLGMTPRRYRARGSGLTIRFAVGQCSLGEILVAHSETGICAILMGDDPEALVHDLEHRFARARLIGGDTRFEQLVARVMGFVDSPATGLDMPLDIRGTAFQRRVWQALRAIPAGSTVTYTDIANRIGAPGAVRAVASACAANPIAVAIPCHRVVRRDGGLAGYRWGVERKRKLLEAERQTSPTPSVFKPFFPASSS
jgi:AraC family transcriptional regulator of adaptative response/methylated-DNA-[protein]-cysteine methyltransferase